MNLDNAMPILTAIIGAIASYILFATQFKFEKTRDQREIASDKLITIVNHLVLFLTIEKDTMIIHNKDLYSKIKSHGSCLPPGIYNSFLKLIEIESKSNNENKCFDNPSYNLLRSQLLSKVRVEQSELTVLYDNNFEKFKEQTILYRNRPFQLIMSKVSNQVSLILIILITCLLLLINYDFEGTFTLSEKVIMLGSVIMILSLTYFCVMCFALSAAKFYDRVSREFSEGIRMYSPDDIVRENGMYKCAICGNIEEQYADTYFSYCRHDKMNFLIFAFKTTIIISYWKLDKDKAGKKN